MANKPGIQRLKTDRATVCGAVSFDVVNREEFQMRFGASRTLTAGWVATVGNQALHARFASLSVIGCCMCLFYTFFAFGVESVFALRMPVKELQSERLVFSALGASSGVWLGFVSPFFDDAHASAALGFCAGQRVSASDDTFSAIAIASPIGSAASLCFGMPIQSDNYKPSESLACKVNKIGSSVGLRFVPKAVKARRCSAQGKATGDNRCLTTAFAATMPKRIFAGLPARVEKNSQFAESATRDVLKSGVVRNRMRLGHRQVPFVGGLEPTGS